MSRLKIVNLGLPKSGTTTLYRALREAGLFVADHRVRGEDTDRKSVRRSFVAAQIYKGYFENGAPLSRLGFYDGLSEISALRNPVSFWPQCDYPVLKAMRDAHPDVKFVTTWRPAKDICDSMQRWKELGRTRIPNATIPGLPHGFGAEYADRIRWIERTHEMHRDLFHGRNNHLELDMASSTAREQLGFFLDHDIPWWGRENVNSDTSDQDDRAA